MKTLALLSGLLLCLLGLANEAALPDEVLRQRSPSTSPMPRPSSSFVWENLLPPLPPADVFLPKASAYPSFNSQRLDEQIQIYADYLRSVGTPDVLIIGSSRALQGVDPTVLQQALAERGYPNLKIYNFSINGATAQVINLVLRQILMPNHLPKLLIWADGLRAFNSGRVDVTYNSIVASEGAKRLATGDRPISPNITSTVPTGVLRERDGDLDSTGFQAVSDRFNSETYYQTHARVAGQYDTSYVPFSLRGEQMAATIAVAQFAAAQNIPLVFVSLPLTQDYLDSARRSYEQQFRRHMQTLAEQEGFMFRDLSQRWLTQEDYFADPSHLNRYGARAVSLELAADTAIPWALLQAP